MLLLALRGPIEDVSPRSSGADDLLEDAREREQSVSTRRWTSARYRRLLSEWQAFLNRPSDASGAANGARPLADVISRRAWRLSRRIARGAGAVDGRSTADELHAVRIAAKKLRYLVDVTPGFYEAADLEHVLVALKKLQRVLGDFNDADVQERRLIDCTDALAASAAACGARRRGAAGGADPPAARAPRGQIVDGLARFRDRERDRPAARVQESRFGGIARMSVVAVYNMKGGVGKTTTAVNLSYLAAVSGRRTLLWDLDPQAACSFAFRIRPHVDGFGRKHLESGRALAKAIKETDYENLDVLPADFTYRKLDRLLARVGKPERVVAKLLEALGRDYDVVSSRLPGRLLAPHRRNLSRRRRRARADDPDDAVAADGGTARQVGRPLRIANGAGSLLQHGRPPEVAPPARERVVGRSSRAVPQRPGSLRQHRGADDHPADAAGSVRAEGCGDVGVCERMGRAAGAVERACGRQSVGGALEAPALRARRTRRAAGWGRNSACSFGRRCGAFGSSAAQSRAANSGRLQPRVTEKARSQAARRGRRGLRPQLRWAVSLERCGYVLELHERPGRMRVVAAQSASDADEPRTVLAEAHVDGTWAQQILTGTMSPLAALQRGSGRPHPARCRPSPRSSKETACSGSARA